jgi:hypothetical protein
VIKEDYIGNTFFDAASSSFFLKSLLSKREEIRSEDDLFSKLNRLKLREPDVVDITKGIALGPQLKDSFNQLYFSKMKHKSKDGDQDTSEYDEFKSFGNVVFEYECEIVKIHDMDRNDEKESMKEHFFPIEVELSNGKKIPCDFIISATGVLPNLDFVGKEFERAEDTSLLVNPLMMTSIKNVYAAGDCCWMDTMKLDSRHWLQMRLWSQARMMGKVAAYSMYHQLSYPNNFTNVNEIVLPIPLPFDLFTHMTYFFGFKVILLGLFNAQGLKLEEYTALIRCTIGKEFIKVILEDGKMQGAVMIGDTDLEETFENLILNQLDLSSYGDRLLDPSIDIEDYFD